MSPVEAMVVLERLRQRAEREYKEALVAKAQVAAALIAAPAAVEGGPSNLDLLGSHTIEVAIRAEEIGALDLALDGLRRLPY